jgi:aspartyl-tRNA(Asn)/glutamyl-tRNA(Gln) amidotransferase subunit A
LKPPHRLAESLRRLRRGSPAAEELLHEARERLDRLGPEDRMLRAHFEVAGDVDGDWWGISYLTKANIAIQDELLDCCSAMLEGFRAPYEATVTARLRRCGASCLGSTNMDEFAMGSSGETSIHGAVEHPFLPGRVCGGSSSGAAAAVARRLVPFALGSDTGGSVRQPAAYCGLVGLKPTWGRVSRYGLVAHASSMDTVGVLSLGVEDARLVLARIEGPDGRDATVRADLDALEPGAVRAVAAVEPPSGTVSDEVLDAFARTLESLRARGVSVRTVSLPSLGAALGAYTVLAAAETASNLARYDGSLYGPRLEAASFEDSLCRTRTAAFGTEVKLRILLGTEVLRKGHTENALGRARHVVGRLAEEVGEALRRCDGMLMPTVPDVAFDLSSRLADPLAMREADRFTVVASLLGLPAVAVPCGQDSRGAPLSVQCIAARGADGRALDLATEVEDVSGVRALQDESWWPGTEEGRR